jgi:hypothetical protein
MATNNTEETSAYYISTSLDIFPLYPLLSRDSTNYLPGNDQDFFINGKLYRILDKHYYLWLLSRIKLAQRAYKLNKLSQDQYNKLICKWKAVVATAVKLWGEGGTKALMREELSASYKSPNINTCLPWHEWIRLAPKGINTWF